MRWIAVMAALAVAAPSQAQVVYKCTGKSGATEYSSWPCKAEQRTVKAIAAPPDPVQRYAPPVHTPAPALTYGQTNHFYTPTQAASLRSIRQARCKAAKDERERTLASVGLKRNFDLLRRLDDVVNQNCAGL